MSEMGKLGITDLHAYIDDELDAEARADVETWLAENPDDRARVDAWKRDRDALSGLLDDVLAEPVPDAMRAVIYREPGASAQRSGHWMRAAASVVLLVVGAIAGWFGHQAQGPAQVQAGGEAGFVRNAVGAHVVFTRERSHAVEVRAGKEKDEQHLVRWLSRRVGRPLNPPSLTGAGYSLVGGRLVADDGGPAAQFMYQDNSKNRLTLYVRNARDAKNTAEFQLISDRGVSAFYWIERPYAYALLGKVERSELVKLGDLVFAHLHTR